MESEKNMGKKRKLKINRENLMKCIRVGIVLGMVLSMIYNAVYIFKLFDDNATVRGVLWLGVPFLFDILLIVVTLKPEKLLCDKTFWIIWGYLALSSLLSIVRSLLRGAKVMDSIFADLADDSYHVYGAEDTLQSLAISFVCSAILLIVHGMLPAILKSQRKGMTIFAAIVLGVFTVVNILYVLSPEMQMMKRRGWQEHLSYLNVVSGCYSAVSVRLFWLWLYRKRYPKTDM